MREYSDLKVYFIIFIFLLWFQMLQKYWCFDGRVGLKMTPRNGYDYSHSFFYFLFFGLMEGKVIKCVGMDTSSPSGVKS